MRTPPNTASLYLMRECGRGLKSIMPPRTGGWPALAMHTLCVRRLCWPARDPRSPAVEDADHLLHVGDARTLLLDAARPRAAGRTQKRPRPGGRGRDP